MRQHGLLPVNCQVIRKLDKIAGSQIHKKTLAGGVVWISNPNDSIHCLVCELG